MSSTKCDQRLIIDLSKSFSCFIFLFASSLMVLPAQETPSLMNVFDRVCIFVLCWTVLSLGCVFTYIGDLLCPLSYFLFLLTSCSLAYFFPLDIMSAGHNWVAPCPVSKNSDSCSLSWCTPRRGLISAPEMDTVVSSLFVHHTHSQTLSYKQVECWETIYIMKKTDIENRLVNTAGEGEVETKWESRIETHTLPYVKQIANGKSTKELILSNWCWRRLLRVP